MIALTSPISIGSDRGASRGSITPRIVVSVQWALGAVLIWAGTGKVQAPLAFLDTVYAYHVLGPRAGLYLATVLPAVEIVLGLCLVGGICRSGATLLTIVLSAIFV